MDREQAKDIVKGYLEDYLRGKGINTRTPFKCLSPEHADKHPSMSFDRSRNRCKCFACGVSYDIFDLIAIDYGLTEQKDIFAKAYELYNITIDKTAPAQQKPAQKQEEKKQENFTEYFKQCKAAVSEKAAQDYLSSRGISEEVAQRFWLGYDQNYKTFNTGADGQNSFTEWRAIIIPTGECSYIARNIDQPAEPAKKNRYRKKGASLIFNSKALYEAQQPIFVVEGEIDALSIIEVGGDAIGLGSTSNYKQLINLLAKEKTAQPLILALDQDEEGKATEDKLAEELEGLQIPFYRYNITGACKDANEALLANRDNFKETIEDLNKLQEMQQQAVEEAIREEYKKTCAASCLQDFKDGITEAANTPAISTGFYSLDDLLDGGLYEGLYIMGAISSLGKTTFALQIIEQVAQQGQDVLIFSLEMSKHELIAKSISRQSYLLAEDKKNAKTTRGITAGARYKRYNQTERTLINNALAAYKDYAQHIYIHEGIGNIGAEQVKEIVQKHISITGNKPVVLIDYLQILAPYEVRASDKQNTDKATLELKRLSRDCKIPVIGISSFNRDNYTAPVNNASFKESGAIEYSADVLIGLQYEGMDYRDGEKDGARQTRIRMLIKDMEKAAEKGEAQKIQVKVLKNRNGRKGQTVFDFYAMFNCFKEQGGFIDAGEITEDPFADLRSKPAK